MIGRYGSPVLAAAIGIALLACAPSASPSNAERDVPASVPAPPDAARALAAREPRSVKVTFAANSASYMDQFVAIERGYYREEGLTIEKIDAGGGAATPALIASEIAFSTSAGSALSAMLHGAPIKVVYTNLDRPGYQLWSSGPDVRTVRDLTGRQVGVPSRGDTHELAVRLYLKKYGIDPGAVAFTALGSNTGRLAALLAASVDATTLTPTDFARLGEPRGSLIADLEQEI